MLGHEFLSGGASSQKAHRDLDPTKETYQIEILAWDEQK